MTSMVKSQKQFADTSCEVEALLGVQDCSHLTLDLLRMQNISKHLKGIVAGVNNGIRDVYNIHVAPRISQDWFKCISIYRLQCNFNVLFVQSLNICTGL